MLRFTCFALIVALAAGLELSANLHDHWTKFKAAHNKEYTSEEEAQRKEIFKQNVEKILHHNLQADLGEHSHKLQINEFADLTHEEFKSKYLGLNVAAINRTSSRSTPYVSSRAAPASRDWTSYMGPVKNQGQCGSCWTFASTGALEGHVAIYSGQRVTLSEQNLLDCASTPKYYSNGCDGGLPIGALQYIADNGGVSSDTCYRYEEKQGSCRYNSRCRSATSRGAAEVPYGNEKALEEIVGNTGPVAIGIDAGQPDFQFAGSNIYYNPRCSTTPNHAVVAVGYGTENGQAYWLVKNSWGTSWGSKGYFKLAKGRNHCGVANLAAYPIV